MDDKDEALYLRTGFRVGDRIVFINPENRTFHGSKGVIVSQKDRNTYGDVIWFKSDPAMANSTGNQIWHTHASQLVHDVPPLESIDDVEHFLEA